MSVLLHCVVIHYVVLHCVVIHCVATVLYLLSCVVLRCLVLCCVVDKFSISSIPSMLKLYIRRTQPTSLTGRQSLHLRTRQTQHHSLTLKQYELHYATNSTNSITLTHWQTKSPRSSQQNSTNKTTFSKRTNLTILTYFKTVLSHNATNSTKSTNCHTLRQTKTPHLDATPYQIGKLNNAHFL